MRMAHLTWSFDWPVNRAVAVSTQGTYVVVGVAAGRWSVAFTRAIPKACDGGSDSDSLNREDLVFPSVADAMHACQRHADKCTPESSGRWSQATPVPG